MSKNVILNENTTELIEAFFTNCFYRVYLYFVVAGK